MIIDYAADLGKADPQALAKIMPTLRRCARAGASKVGGEHLFDDVVQELTLLLINKLAERYSQEYQIEPILIESARRITLGMLHANRDFSRPEFPYTPREDAAPYNVEAHETSFEPLANDPHELPITDLDQARALQFLQSQQEKIMGIMPGIVIDGTTPARLKPPAPKVKKKASPAAAKKVQRTLTPEQEEMRRIRLELNLSQAEWAVKLDVSAATVAAYEYGRTQSVCNKAYQKALKEAKKGSKMRQLRQRFDHLKMSEIVAMWAERMMVAPDDMATLAKFLKKEVSTIHRWLNNTQRPDIKSLEKYDEIATAQANTVKAENAEAIKTARRELVKAAA